ncbi:hypothetical protein FB45DRAFT_1097008 [Roridomyces roridus]|uniref:Uncharacterized protein n=1 Tax=Roridomyces roridus TaxID=1738132 RepID=A0AAD7FH74_9AGAR|nr:hypothetical protein FB45DRAFT_1097008 [Roridomyces roridus]
MNSQRASLPQQPLRLSSKVDLETHVEYLEDRTSWLLNELKTSENQCRVLQEEKDRMQEERDRTRQLASDLVCDLAEKTKKNGELVAILRREHEEAQTEWKGVEERLQKELVEVKKRLEVVTQKQLTETRLHDEAREKSVLLEQSKARLREERDNARAELEQRTQDCRTLIEAYDKLQYGIQAIGFHVNIIAAQTQPEVLRARLGGLRGNPSGQEETSEIETHLVEQEQHTMRASSPFLVPTPLPTPLLQYCEPADMVIPKIESVDDLELQYPELQGGDVDETLGHITWNPLEQGQRRRRAEYEQPEPSAQRNTRRRHGPA